MFGKLLKNDMKAQFFTTSILLIVMASVAVAAEVMIYTSDASTPSGMLARGFGGLLVSLALTVAWVIMMVVVALLFNRSLFDNEGYLTLSLPVKTSSLVLSKMVSGLIWIFTVFALMIGSFILWIHQASEIMGDEGISALSFILELVKAPSIDVLGFCAIMFAILVAISTLLIVESMFFGITLSHVSPLSKLGKFGAIVFTIVAYIVLNKFIDIVANSLPFGMIVTEDNYIFASNIFDTGAKYPGSVAFNFTTYVLTLIVGLGLNVPVIHLIKKKVNI